MEICAFDAASTITISTIPLSWIAGRNGLSPPADRAAEVEGRTWRRIWDGHDDVKQLETFATGVNESAPCTDYCRERQPHSGAEVVQA